ncbi:MAG: tail fiber domain-containing protein [Muribaculaceae bacterium]|nr:tail fiber domain-containing protein [Muribaculaceae bacterium]
MRLKSLFIGIALMIFMPFVSNAQIYVDSLGVVQVGNYELDIFDGLLPCERDSNICLSVKGYGDMWSGSKITFGDAGSNSMMNVSVGELKRVVGVTGIIDDTDRLWLHGKNGLYYTSARRSQDTVFYYDRYLSNDFHFNCNVLASNIALASDSRFKTDITPLESSLQTITSLTPVSYKLLPRFGNDADEIPTGTLSEKELQDIENARKFYQSLENDGPHFGFIAQEVKEIYPELVKTDHDGYMYIDYIGMIPLLVHAIGELNAQIEELKAENSELNQAVINAQAPAVGNGQPSQIADDFLRNALYQNRPNPFSTSTTISMSLRSDVAQAMVYIFDMQGALLKTIPVNDRGNVSITINGGELNAGMYIYSLIADGNEVASKRMILTK